mgnify:CR=1 FL=1
MIRTSLKYLVLASAVLFVSSCETPQKSSDEAMVKQLDQIRTEIAALRTNVNAMNKKVEKVLKEVETKKPKDPFRRKKQKADKKKRKPVKCNVDVKGAPFKGPQSAPVTIVEFFDVQCPYCSREYPKLKKVMDMYPDKIKLVLKHYPLSFHKDAWPAHAAMIMAYQKKGNPGFWKMHDMIVENSGELGIDVLKGYAEQLDLDMEWFNEVIDDRSRIKQLLSSELKDAGRCNVRGTPSVFINGVKLRRRSIENYKKRIDEILEAHKNL